MKQGVRGATVAAALLLTASLVAPAAPAQPRRGAASSQQASATTPFARVYLALRGCTSCAHCRTAIRQMARIGADGGEARLSGDNVEVRYAKARTVPLREVIHSLATNRLHDLALVDVLFEARGTLALNERGAGRFVLSETGQSFPISVGATLSKPAADGKPVRVTAVVDGWRGKGAISLVAREVQPGA